MPDEPKPLSFIDVEGSIQRITEDRAKEPEANINYEIFYNQWSPVVETLLAAQDFVRHCIRCGAVDLTLVCGKCGEQEVVNKDAQMET